MVDRPKLDPFLQELYNQGLARWADEEPQPVPEAESMAGEISPVISDTELSRPDLTSGSDNLSRAIAYVDKMPAAISGNGGHQATWAVAVAAKGFDLDKAGIMQVLRHYNTRCQPPWSELELEHKAADAVNGQLRSGFIVERDSASKTSKTSATVAPAVPPLQNLRVAVAGDEPGWESQLLRKTIRDKIVIEECVENLVVYLSSHPAWAGSLAYDTFLTRIVVQGSVPFERHDTQWSDIDDTRVQTWFERHTTLRPGIENVRRAVEAVASQNRVNCVTAYLDSLKWDGVTRVDTVLIDRFGSPDNEYVRAVTSKWFLSAIGRAYNPGCQCDYILILEGGQGFGKSKFLTKLCPIKDWFCDNIGEVGSKSQAENIEGKWIVELAELDAMNRAEVTAVKSFATRDIETYRPAYGRRSVTRPRACVFAGTVNPGANGYLKDETGARRFWPVVCANAAQPLDEQTRDQLWAEAVSRYKGGEITYIDQQRVVAMAEAEQSARRFEDEWVTKIKEWLEENPNKTCVSTVEVLSDLFDIPTSKVDRGLQMRIASCLKEIGWVKRQHFDKIAKRNRWLWMAR